MLKEHSFGTRNGDVSSFCFRTVSTLLSRHAKTSPRRTRRMGLSRHEPNRRTLQNVPHRQRLHRVPTHHASGPPARSPPHPRILPHGKPLALGRLANPRIAANRTVHSSVDHPKSKPNKPTTRPHQPPSSSKTHFLALLAPTKRTHSRSISPHLNLRRHRLRLMANLVIPQRHRRQRRQGTDQRFMIGKEPAQVS